MLKRLDGVEREYDGFGRMTLRRDKHRGVTQRFGYDDEHRISEVQIEGDRDYARAAYRYDALGRRTEKAVWRHGAQAPERTAYGWSGMQMVGEWSDRRPDAAVQYIYEENSYAPLARVDSIGDAAEIYWYHAELNGLPERMTDAGGETVWRGAFSAWGRTLRESARGGWHGQQNLRFQGQYLDRETGLHYNTLRYYDAWGGCYTQVDPIGLAGGLNTYAYAPNPLSYIDPLGLTNLNSVQQQIDAVLREHLPAIQAIDPNATIGYRGSAASGISKAHDPNISRPINLNNFDVDAFIQSDYLANDPVFTNRRRDASKIAGMSEIEASIDRKLRSIFPGLREESFGFRIFKSHELSDMARRGDVQHKVGCK